MRLLGVKAPSTPHEVYIPLIELSCFCSFNDHLMNRIGIALSLYGLLKAARLSGTDTPNGSGPCRLHRKAAVQALLFHHRLSQGS